MNSASNALSRRSLLGGGVALAAALTLPGCGRQSATSQPTTAVAAVDTSPATGTVEFWAGGADAVPLPKFLTAFEKDNPGLTVNVTQIPEGDFDAKVTTAIASGKVPDLVYLYSQTQTTMLKTGAFAPVPAGLVDPAVFFPTQYSTTVLDGTSYAVPWYTYSNTFYYRKDLAQKAGVAAPTTWAELKTFAAALQKGGSTWGFGLSVGYDQYTAQSLDEYVHQNGGSLISEDRRSWTINAPANVAATEFWGSLFADGYASPDGPQFLDTTPWFTSGKMAAVTNGPWFPGWLDEANGKGWSAEHVGTVAPPAGPAGSVASMGGGSFAVLKDAANSDASWKLVRYLSQPATQVSWYDTFGNLPSVQAAWKQPAIADNSLLAPVEAALATAKAVPQVAGWGQVGPILGKQLERLARGKATAQEVLDEAQSQAAGIGTGAN